MRPNEFVFGTLIGNAARQKKYEYLTALLKVNGAHHRRLEASN